MELSEIKNEFKDYLSSKNVPVEQETPSEDTEINNEVSNEISNEVSQDYCEEEEYSSQNVSVFSHTDEFEDFLEENYSESLDNSSIKKDELLKLEFKDGQFIEETNDVNTQETINKEILDNNSKEQDKLPLIGILNDLLTDDTIKSKIDTDADGIIANEEITSFINSIEDLDGEKGDISIKDLIKGTKKLKNDELNKTEDKPIKEIQEEEKSTIDDLKILQNIDFNNKNLTNPITDTNVFNLSSMPSTNYFGTANLASGGWFGGTSTGGYNYMSNYSPLKTSTPDNSANELEKQKAQKETEVKNAQNAYKQVFLGDNQKVKSAQNSYNTSKEKYENLINSDDGLTDEQKQKLKTAIEKVENAQSSVDEAEIKLQDAENNLNSQKNIVSQTEANLNALKEASNTLTTGDNSQNSSDITTKVSSTQTSLSTEKSKLNEFQKQKDLAEKELSSKKNELQKAQSEKSQLEKELILNNDNVSSNLKSALSAFNNAEKELQNVKANEASNAKTALSKAEGELSKINTQISQKKAEQIKQENSSSNFSFNFQENLTSGQKSDLEAFKANYAKNKDKYKEVEKQTGMPAELIAAIHWRESSGDFSTYLHNGEKLGKTTTLVPEGIYFGADQWTEAAVDAIKRQGTSGVNPKDLKSVLDFAERYNGLGYRNKGVASPYVWAGTTNYHGGKYVADGIYSAGTYDQQLGVAVMMKAIS